MTKKPFFSILPPALLVLCLAGVVGRNGGWNLADDTAVFRRHIPELTDEEEVTRRFARLPSFTARYRIGILAVTDHRPYFGGNAYRVYGIGYTDFDGKPVYLGHVACADGRILRIEPIETGQKR